MIDGLHGFVRALRRAGLSVSPAEWLDATRALGAIDLGRRDRVRAALRVTLVKRRGDLPAFDRTFDAWFRGPAPGGGGRSGRRPGAEGPGAGRGRGEEGAQGTRRPDRREPSRSERRRPDTEPSAARSTEAAADPESVADPQAAAAERLRRLRRGEPVSEQRIGRLRRVVRTRGADGDTPSPARDPLRAVLRSRLDADEEAAIAAELPRLLARLRRRPARRLREARRGALYLRRVYRRNAAHGGVPFLLPRRRRKRRPPRIVVLLDVSWSVARAAALFLMLAESLLRRLPDTRLLPFVDRPVDATAELTAWLAGTASEAIPEGRRRPADGLRRGGVSFARLLDGLTALQPEAASDYGRALHALETGPTRLGRRDWLVVLGDGRTNRFDPQPWALEELRDRIGGILWLVPEPVGEWGTGDSALASYAPHVDVLVEAADAFGLAAGVRELARATRAGSSTRRGGGRR